MTALLPAPGVASAPDLDTARAALAAAETSIALAHGKLATTREAFMGDPTPEKNAEVEQAEAELRAAERLREARSFGLRSVTELLAAAERLKAEEELKHAGEVLAQLRRELRGAFTAAGAHYNQACGHIATIEELVARYAHVCTAANSAANRAGAKGEAKALDLDLVRRAFASTLTGGRHRVRHKVTQHAALHFQELLGILDRGGLDPITLDDQRAILQLAQLELARITDDGPVANVAAWFTPLHEAPQRLFAGSTEASRYELAKRLLAALENEK